MSNNSENLYTLDEILSFGNNLPFDIKVNLTKLEKDIKAKTILKIYFLDLLELYNIDYQKIKGENAIYKAYKTIYSLLLERNIQIIPFLIPHNLNLYTQLCLIEAIDLLRDNSIIQANKIPKNKVLKPRDRALIKEAQNKLFFFNLMKDVFKHLYYIAPSYKLDLCQRELLTSYIDEGVLPSDSVRLFKTWLSFILEEGLYRPHYEDESIILDKVSSKKDFLAILSKIYNASSIKMVLRGHDPIANYLNRYNENAAYALEKAKQQDKYDHTRPKILDRYQSLFEDAPYFFLKEADTDYRELEHDKSYLYLSSLRLKNTQDEAMQKFLDEHQDFKIFDLSYVNYLNKEQILSLILNDKRKLPHFTLLQTTNCYSPFFIYKDDEDIKNFIAIHNSEYNKNTLGNILFSNLYIAFYNRVLGKKNRIPLYVNKVNLKDLRSYRADFNNIHKLIDLTTVINDLNVTFSKDYFYKHDIDVIRYFAYLVIHDTNIAFTILCNLLYKLKDYISNLKDKSDKHNLYLYSLCLIFIFFLYFKKLKTINLEKDTVFIYEVAGKIYNFFIKNKDNLNSDNLKIYNVFFNSIDLFLEHISTIAYDKSHTSKYGRLLKSLRQENTTLTSYLNFEINDKKLFLAPSTVNNIQNSLLKDLDDDFKNIAHNILGYTLAKDILKLKDEQDLDALPSFKDIIEKVKCLYIESEHYNILFKLNELNLLNNVRLIGFFNDNLLFENTLIKLVYIENDKELFNLSQNIEINKNYDRLLYCLCVFLNLLPKSLLEVSGNEIALALLKHYVDTNYQDLFLRYLQHYVSLLVQKDDGVFTNLQKLMEKDKNFNIEFLSFANLNNKESISKPKVLKFLSSAFIELKNLLSTKISNNIEEQILIFSNIKYFLNDEHPFYFYLHHDVLAQYNNTASTNANYAQMIKKILEPKLKSTSLQLDFSMIDQKLKESNEIQEVISKIKDDNDDSISIESKEETVVNLQNDIESNEVKQDIELESSSLPFYMTSSLDDKLKDLISYIDKEHQECLDLDVFKQLAIEKGFMSHSAPIELINDYFYEVRDDLFLDLDEESNLIYVTLDLLNND